MQVQKQPFSTLEFLALSLSTKRPLTGLWPIVPQLGFLTDIGASKMRDSHIDPQHWGSYCQDTHNKDPLFHAI